MYTSHAMSSKVILRLATISIVTFLVGGYTFLKLANLEYYASDHGIYIYASHLFSQGIIPYRDFFFSHPPLQISLSTILVLITGTNLTVPSVLPAFIGLISGMLIFLISFEALKSQRPIIRWSFPLLASALFLFSHTNLVTTLSYTGHNLAVMLLLIGTFLFLKQKKFWSGAVSGLAMMAGIQAVVGFAVLCILQFMWNKKKIKNLILGFVASTGLIHLIFTILAGSNFWKQVYLYHFAKPAEDTYLAGKMHVLTFMFKANPHLALLALIGCALLVMRFLKSGQIEDEHIPREKLITMSPLMCGAYVIFLLFMHPIFPHYFLPLAAFASILGADVVMQVLRKMDMPTRLLSVSHLAITVIIILATLTLYHTFNIYKKEQMLTTFNHAEKVSARIQELTKPDETIYGDFGIIPLISLLSERRIAADEIDTSAMRFISGLYDVQEVIKAIEANNIKAVIGRVNRGIPSYFPFKKYLEENFFLAERIEPERVGAVVEVWLRR